MFRTTAIRNEKSVSSFLTDLKDVLMKHDVVILHGKHHVEFLKDSKKVAQCFCANGGSAVK